MTQNEAHVYGGTLIFVGLSQVIRWIPPAQTIDGTLRLAAGNSLEIVEPQLSGSSTAAGNAWGKGYLLGSSEIYSFYGPAIFYLAATGATASVAISTGRTAGATVL